MKWCLRKWRKSSASVVFSAVQKDLTPASAPVRGRCKEPMIQRLFIYCDLAPPGAANVPNEVALHFPAALRKKYDYLLEWAS